MTAWWLYSGTDCRGYGCLFWLRNILRWDLNFHSSSLPDVEILTCFYTLAHNWLCLLSLTCNLGIINCFRKNTLILELLTYCSLSFHRDRSRPLLWITLIRICCLLERVSPVWNPAPLWNLWWLKQINFYSYMVLSEHEPRKILLLIKPGNILEAFIKELSEDIRFS